MEDETRPPHRHRWRKTVWWLTPPSRRSIDILDAGCIAAPPAESGPTPGPSGSVREHQYEKRIDDIRGEQHEGHTNHSKFGPRGARRGRNPRRGDRREGAGHRRHPHLSHGVRGDGGEHHLRHPDGEGGREPHRRRAGNPRLHVQRAGDGGGAPVEEAGLRHRGRHHPARDAGRRRGARAVPARAHPHQVQAPARGKLLGAGQVLRHSSCPSPSPSSSSSCTGKAPTPTSSPSRT